MPELSRNEGPFSEFARRYGPPEPGTPARVAPPELEQLPPELAHYWRIHGFGGYGNGLIWTHPPSSFRHVLEEWLQPAADDPHLVVRFSFGDFCFWSKDHLYLLDVHFGRITELGQRVDFLFEYLLCREEFLLDVVRRELHGQCLEKLGPIKHDECFAFVPARSLGGTEAIENVQKATLAEHLALLAGLNGPLKLR